MQERQSIKDSTEIDTPIMMYKGFKKPHTRISFKDSLQIIYTTKNRMINKVHKWKEKEGVADYL